MKEILFKNIFIKNMNDYYNLYIKENGIECISNKEENNLFLDFENFGHVKNSFQFMKFNSMWKITKLIYMFIIILLFIGFFKLLSSMTLIFYVILGCLCYGLYYLYEKYKNTLKIYMRDNNTKMCYAFFLVFENLNEKQEFYNLIKKHNKLGFCIYTNFSWNFK